MRIPADERRRIVAEVTAALDSGSAHGSTIT
jgi:hypothetical protein